MYYVPDGTRLCGFYECSECHSRFLSLMTAPSMICPACGRAVDYEIGPDEEMPELKEDAKLVKIIEDFLTETFAARRREHGNDCGISGMER